MERRKFLSGSLAVTTVGLAGCLGDDEGDGEEECLPEDGSEFIAMDADEIDSWAPRGDGFTLDVVRNPTRPSADLRQDREEDEATHWLDLTYSDEDDNAYGMRIELYNEEQFAEDAGSTARTGSITYPAQAPIDGNAAISGARGRYVYIVRAESEEQSDRARELFLMIQCVEEEHIQDTTW